MSKLSRRYFLKIALAGAAEMTLLTSSSMVYGAAVEPGWISVDRISLQLPHLRPAFDGYRLVQISDLHIDDGMSQKQLHEVVDTINEMDADLVAITGDFVSADADGYADVLERALSRLYARDGVVAVPGNHDYWSNIDTIRRMLHNSGIRDLSNTVMTIQRGNDRLHIAGVDDIWENKHDLDAALAQLPSDGAAILLAHEPDFADTSAAAGRFDLTLSGHSHGGQIDIPFVGAPVLPYLGKKYPSGLYQVGDMWQYTNRGLASVIPIRINCRPEITELTLVS